MDLNLCPVCGAKMKPRTNTTTGQKFWGCTEFPRCRGTRNTDGEAPRPLSHDLEDDYRRDPDSRRPNRRW
jgi:ssDNA-binding Zn-finger/Zn-ribbon topoisomerase 1